MGVRVRGLCNQEQQVSPWFSAEQQASFSEGEPARMGKLDPSLLWVSMGSVHLMPCLLAPDLSSILHAGPPAPLPRSDCPRLSACAESWQLCPRLAGPAGEGLRLPPDLYRPAVASPPCPPFGRVQPPPPCQTGLAGTAEVSTETLTFPGFGAGRAKREVGGFAGHSSNCCWLREPLSSHGFWRGPGTATTEVWQVPAEGGGWPTVGS